MSTIRVVLADDHPVVRNGVRTMLEESTDIVVIGEASTGIETIHLVEALAPDVLLLDLQMPAMTGVEVAQHLSIIGSAVRVLILSAYAEEQSIVDLLASGVSGYLTKDEALMTIADAVHAVMQGEEGWFSRRVTAKVVKQQQTQQREGRSSLDLSSRECQVLQLIAQGHDNHHIATSLGISSGTVKNYITSIYNKLDVHTRAEAVAWAWQQGFMHNSMVRPMQR